MSVCVYSVFVLAHVHTQRHRSYGKMSYDFFAVRPSES
jgi:hypothetical protein